MSSLKVNQLDPFIVNHISSIKDRQDEDATLALIAALQQSLKELSDAHEKESSEEPSPVNPSNSEDQSEAAYPQLMAKMAAVLAQLQALIVECSSKKTGYDAQIAKAQIDELNLQLKDLQNQVEKLRAEAPAKTFFSIFEKVIEVALAVVVAAAALLTGQIFLAGMILVMTILQTSGAFNQLADAISKSLQQDGCPKEIADLVSKVLVILMVVVIAGFLAPNAAVEEVATDAAESSGAAAADASTSEATSTITSKIGEFINKINKFNRLSLRTNVVISTGAQTAASVNIVQDISKNFIEFIAQKTHMSDGLKQTLEEVLGIILSLMLMIMQTGSSLSMMNSLNVVKTEENATSWIKILRSKLQNFTLENSGVLTKLVMARCALMLGGGLSGIGTGTISILQGQIENKIGDDSEGIILAQSRIEMLDSSIQSSQKHDADVMASFVEKNKMLSHLFAGEQAFARLLTNV